ncbi:hypothetical protein PT447_00135 [Aliarcobacter butzleri]|uniref:hypothetical protein n=1 Tax=Aliarcobacter butzleri TaxID=28197 RepID=UPI0024DE2F21|nr:hypothetical protein [Aliarcobacter butzleri]MDK2063327.1 hypothetical protein [Aliarcobacter butzleri]
MKKILKIMLNSFLSFNFILFPAFANTNEIEADERTLEKINTFLKSGTPSDIPFIDYMESFANDNSQPLKRFDLSDYEGKKVFLGYGIYDKGQNFCKYVEKPGMPDPKLYFQNITTFNKHTYALSMTTMNYNSCINLANQFNGTPVVITSAPENSFVYSKYNGLSKWIGLERASCLEEYKNKDGLNQEYFNWSSLSETGGSCDTGKLNVIQNNYGTWNKKDKSELNFCLVEIDTEEITRPIKICAPWWRIEREYQKETETIFGGIDVYKINQADIPEQFNICTKFEEKAIATTNESVKRKVTCTSYYDSMIAPECLKNPYQDICYVDECNGYIKNACRIVNTLSGFKNYTKAEAVIDGAKKIIKGKSDIKTHVYECPPSLPSLQSCEEQSTVIIFPKECPGSDCEGYKTCVQNSSTITEKNNCSTKFNCEKIYGSPDNVEYNTDGSIKFLKNTCSNGTTLTFEPSIQNKESKKCLEYEYYTIEEEVSQKCVLDRPFTDHIVDTSLTEEDIYMNNPKCIRLNNVLDSRPTVEVKVDYINNGFSQTVLKKSYLDGEENIDIREGSDLDSMNAAMDVVKYFEGIKEKKENEVIKETARDINCSEYTEEWGIRNDKIINNYVVINQGLPTEKKYLPTAIASDNGTTLYVKYLNVPDNTTCNSIKTKIGGTGIDYTSTSKVCLVNINKLSADKFSLIKGNGSLESYPNEIKETINNVSSDEDCLSLQISKSGTSYSYTQSTKVCEIYKDDTTTSTAYTDYTYITDNPITKKACDNIAYCLNGIFNESAYASAGSSQCQITTGENYEYVESATLETIDSFAGDSKRDENCVPKPTNGSYLSQLNGTQDIYSIQEVITGDFGYYSNYNSHPFTNNVVKVNNKQVYPIKETPVLDDPLIYEGNFKQTSIFTIRPNYLVGFFTGGVVSVALSEITGITLGNITFMIASIIFNKKVKLNEQRFKWVIYKLVPQERYIHNIYGYDHRVLKLNPDGTVYVDSQNRVKLIYAELDGFSGTLKPNDFKAMLNNFYVQKESLLTCMGWNKSNVANISHSVEKQVLVDYPKCKTLAWKCDKKNTKEYNHNKNPFFKRMTNNYVGALNGLSIVVPYLGDYELKAFDQFDNLLGTIIIKENDFIESTTEVAKYAQVMFGLNMDLADGINEGTKNNACRYDLMTEWGGGVSGIYYENNNTGNNVNCQKSQDSYVKLNSATKISIRSLTTDRPHIINLVKPLPFANKIFLTTLNEKEIREYRCYQQFGECNKQNSFKTIQN